MTELEREDQCVSTNSNNTEDSGVGSFSGSVNKCEAVEGRGEVRGEMTHNKDQITTKQRRTKFPDIGVTNYADGEEIINTLTSRSYQGKGEWEHHFALSRQNHINIKFSLTSW